MASLDYENISQGCTSMYNGFGTGKMKMLAYDFKPGDDDVICGRGKKCYNHVGNDRFRRRVITMLDEYSIAKTKLDKSAVLSKLVDQIRNCSPEGGFVKQDNKGRWYEVGDFLAREKSSQAFRDALHERYKSSNVSKKKRRQEEQAKSSEKVTKLPQLDYDLSSRLDWISTEMLRAPTDTKALDLFNQTNLELLRRQNNLSNNCVPTSRRYHAKNSNISRPMTFDDLYDKSYKSAKSGGQFFPDPLFGPSFTIPERTVPDRTSSNNSSRTTMSDSELYPMEMKHRPKIQRAHSFSESSSYEPLDFTADLEPLHHSMPNMDLGFENEPADISTSLNLSIPNFDHSESTTAMEIYRMGSQTLDIEPLPLNEHPVFGHEKDEFTKVKRSRTEHNGTLESDSRHCISKDILLCLQKMSDHSLGGLGLYDLEESKHIQKQSRAACFSPVLDFDEDPLEFAE